MQLKVLVVDGAPSVAFLIRDFATRLGCRVTSTHSTGVDALAAARRDAPDLALVDLHLCGALSGVQVARELIGDLDVPVLFLTALPCRESEELASRIGASALLAKPFAVRDFRNALDVALAGSTVREAASS